MLPGIILTLVTLIVIFIKSTIYSVVFCLKTIAFMSKNVTPCYICPGLSIPLVDEEMCIGDEPINMTTSFYRVTVCVFITNTVWFLLLTTCMCFTKYTRTFDLIFALCNFNALLSLATFVYGKFNLTNSH